jgi:hypothetical protein
MLAFLQAVRLHRMRILAGSLAFIGIAVFVLLSTRSSPFAFVGAIPLLAGLFILGGKSGTPHQSWPRLGLLSSTAGWIALSIAIISGLDGPRPIMYYAAISAGITFLAAGPLLDVKRTRLAITGILVAFIVVRLSSYQSFHTFQGSDSFFHHFLSNEILKNGQIASVDVADKYSVTAGLHLVSAITAMFSKLSLADAMFWSTALSQLVAPLAFIAIARRFAAIRLVAFASAILAFDATLVLAAVNFTPGSLVLALFCALLLIWDVPGTVASWIFIVLSAAMLITHQLATFVVILFCTGSMLFGQVFPQLAERPARPILAAVFSLAYFLVNVIVMEDLGGSFFGAIARTLQIGVEDVAVGEIDRIADAATFSLTTNFLFKLSLVFTSAIAIAGSVFLLFGTKRIARSWGFAGIFVVGFAFGLPLLGIDLVADRWMPLAILGALLGVPWLIASWPNAARAVLACGLVALAFIGVAQPTISQDNTFYADERNVRTQFYYPDVRAAARLSESDRIVYSDLGATGLLRVFGREEARSTLSLPQVEGTMALPLRGDIWLREDLLRSGDLHFNYHRSLRYGIANDDRFLSGALDGKMRYADLGASALYRMG